MPVQLATHERRQLPHGPRGQGVVVVLGACLVHHLLHKELVQVPRPFQRRTAPAQRLDLRRGLVQRVRGRDAGQVGFQQQRRLLPRRTVRVDVVIEVTFAPRVQNLLVRGFHEFQYLDALDVPPCVLLDHRRAVFTQVLVQQCLLFRRAHAQQGIHVPPLFWSCVCVGGMDGEVERWRGGEEL